MATGRDIWDIIVYDVGEDPVLGFKLGLISDQQVLDLINLTVSDFLIKTGICKRIYTQTIFAGQPQYAVPDDIERVDACLIGGSWAPRTTQRELSNAYRNWRTDLGVPIFFYEDGLPIKTMGIAPPPIFNGAYILGPNEPDPPHAVYDSFSANAVIGTTTAVFDAQSLQALTIVGPQKPTMLATLDDPIPLLPDDVSLAYIQFGVLERIYTADSELKELSCAAFCRAQYAEGVNLMAAVGCEMEEMGQ
jgi:hypothetical protein